jgi:hypothetical protein
MGRPPGAKNKKTIAREAAQASLLAATQPFDASQASRVEAESTSEPTPTLPQAPAAEKEFVEYRAPSGDQWRIENGKALLADFGLEQGQVVKWHEALATEPRVWQILRLRYGVAPLIGETNVDFLRPHSLEEIGVPLALDAAAVTSQIESAKSFWIRWRIANTSRLEAPKAEEAAIPPDEQAKLLADNGFSDLSDPNEKTWASRRLRNFEHKLADEEGGPLVIQAIRAEIQLTRVDKIIDDLSVKAITDSESRDELKQWMNMRDKVSTQHLSLMEALNATQEQNPSAQRKVAFVDCLGTLVKAQQDYEARGDTTLIDGIHTAAEIKFLVTPTTLRPAQYRPDLIAVLNDALEHHNLWNPDYVPPVLDRATHRKLLKGFQEGVRLAASQDGGVVDLEDEEASAPVADEALGSSGTAASNVIELPPAASSPAALASAGGSRRSQSRPGDDFVT